MGGWRATGGEGVHALYKAMEKPMRRHGSKWRVIGAPAFWLHLCRRTKVEKNSLYQRKSCTKKHCCAQKPRQVALGKSASLRLDVPELSITTVKTKLQGDAHLAAQILDGEKGEQIVTLLRIDGEERQIDHFKEEWLRTIERTLPHAEEEAYERLEGALKELNGLLKGTLISGNVREINALIALYDTEGVMHVAQAGRAEAYLTRSGRTVQITEGSAARDGAQFLHLSRAAP